MQGARCLHDIRILNVSDGDVVKQSLLLIRGRILNHSQRTDSCDKHHRIELFSGSHSFEESCEKDEEFKFILELSDYVALAEDEVVDVELRFKYCSKELTLKLFVGKPQTAYKLQPIYILCTDETESPLTQTHCEQIDVNLRLVQALYADRIREELGHASTFVLKGACEIFRSDIKKKEAWNADENFLWSYFAEELLRKNCFGDGKIEKLKIVAFIGCTKYYGSDVLASGDLSYNNIRKHLRGHAALGGGDLALFGSGFFYAWPSRVDQIGGCLRNTRKINPSVEPDESNYRRTYLGVYATTLGAVCHELGHIFDCGHTQDGIMGSGFDYVNRLLTITNRTENLPKRIIEKAQTTTTTSSKNTTPHCRLTKVKRNTNGFLDSYREQKRNDCFFFTKNCAIILANNKWFKNLPKLSNESAHDHIAFDVVNGIVSCVNQFLKIIEIREKSNGLVKKYFEFCESTHQYRLEVSDVDQLEKTHYLYVLTDQGESTRLELHKKGDNENSK